MIRVHSLASGSKGNCVLVQSGGNNILIDAGLNFDATLRKLRSLDVELTDIDAVFITHEHDDHIKALDRIGVIVPVYSHAKTLSQIERKFKGIPSKNLQPLGFDGEANVKNFNVKAIETSHDAVRPYGYIISDGSQKFSYVTDTGFVSEGLFKAICNSDIVMLESNHDLEMLKRGRYPERLKQRIISDKGHLSNQESALTLRGLVEKGARRVILAHISEENNLPELAYWTVCNHLSSKGIDRFSYDMKVASQYETVSI